MGNKQVASTQMWFTSKITSYRRFLSTCFLNSSNYSSKYGLFTRLNFFLSDWKYFSTLGIVHSMLTVKIHSKCGLNAYGLFPVRKAECYFWQFIYLLGVVFQVNRFTFRTPDFTRFPNAYVQMFLLPRGRGRSKPTYLEEKSREETKVS